MRKVALAFLLVVLLTPPAFADQSSVSQQALLHRAKVKIWLGVGLMTAGALVLPVTGINEAKGTRVFVGAAVLMGGTGVLLWGLRDRQRAANPHVTVGLSFGRGGALYFRKAW